MVIRDILQFSKTKEDAVAIAQKAKRTWSVWLGIGDYKVNVYTEEPIMFILKMTMFILKH